MKGISYRLLRRKAFALIPKTMMGRLTLYVLLLRTGVYLLQWILGVAGNEVASKRLDGWGTGFTFLLGCLVIVLLLRWMRNEMLWRLRNRLIVTYMFIGVIPVLLILTMVAIAGWIFANQYATAQPSIAMESEIRSLELVTTGIAEQSGRAVRPEPVRLSGPRLAHLEKRFPGLQIAMWQKGKKSAIHGEQTLELQIPEWAKGNFRGIVEEDQKLYLRTVVAGPNDVVVLSSVPLGKVLVDRAAAGVGLVRFFAFNEVPDETRNARRRLVISQNDGAKKTSLEPANEPLISGGAIPPHGSLYLDPTLDFPTVAAFRRWSTGKEGTIFLTVSTRPSVIFDRLFAYAGGASTIWIGALVGLAIFFAVIEIIALFFGVGLTRTITKSVSNLYFATQQVNRGNLKYRIPVKNKDQLAALQTSFNSMSENLEKLIEEQKIKERLEGELAIAQEVQATLFPREIAQLECLEVHGVCRPARTVSGDYYDFLPCGNEQLGIAVGDISGKGISAALLMATVHSAVRAYEFGRMPMRHEFVRAGAAAIAAAESVSGGPDFYVDNGMQSPGLALGLLNRHLFHSTQPEKYATLFLGVYDGNSQTMTYSNGGHLPPIIVSEDGTVRRLEVGGMVIGLFDEMTYDEAKIKLRSRDIFVAFSDGITEPENEFGEFGEDRLIELVRANRHLPLTRLSEIVTTAVQDWIGAAEQPDDVTLVLARAR